MRALHMRVSCVLLVLPRSRHGWIVDPCLGLNAAGAIIVLDKPMVGCWSLKVCLGVACAVLEVCHSTVIFGKTHTKGRGRH